MIIRNKIRKNAYYDSATLMLITNRMAEGLGAKNVAVMMGTEMNKEILKESNLLTDEGAAVSANDLVFAARGEDQAAVDEAIGKAEEALEQRASQSAATGLTSVRTIDSALKEMPDANIAVLSIPGQYARSEVTKALDRGLHVVLFSDNVSVEDEIALKDHALSRGLLMMGPDCGTAIINDTPLAFANVIDRGDIGIVAASGTGLQEASVLISRNGGGITQGIGTGGRDVKEAVGGRMMLAGIDALNEDAGTKVILLVAKPPATNVVQKLSERVRTIKKPVVTCFLGDRAKVPAVEGAIATYTLEAAAYEALALAGRPVSSSGLFSDPAAQIQQRVDRERAKLAASQQYIRGLYAGGTLCYEAILIVRDTLTGIHTNTPVSPDEELQGRTLVEHSFLDLGEDEFTRGRPHPMIEPTLRNQWVLEQADDPSVAVVLLDVVIGFGAHADPAGVAADAIREARATAQKDGRYLCVVASVCGTEGDYQGFQKQKRTLEEAGAVVMPSNAQAARFAVLVAGGSLKNS